MPVAAAAEALPALDVAGVAVTLSLPTPRQRHGGLLGLMVRLGAPGHRSISWKGKQRALVLLSLFSTPLQSLL